MRLNTTTVLGIAAMGVFVLAGCGSMESDGFEDSQAAAATAPPPAPTTALQPAPTTTIPESGYRALTEAENNGFGSLCSNYVMKGAFLGDPELQQWWDRVGQEEDELRSDCERISATDPERARTIHTDAWHQFELLYELERASSATSTTTPPAPTTTTPPAPTTTTRPYVPTTVSRVPPRAAPSIRINCGYDGNGWYEWMHVTYGYSYSGDIVEWGMDYGDGKSFVARSKNQADQDLFWHKYWSPGSYRVRAWVIDSFGRRDEASCTFNWWAPSSRGRSGGGSGDLDCEDVGYEHWVGSDDPHNLDGDGDGWACEGW